MFQPKYTHLSQRNQILKRPGQHIGSIKNIVQKVWLTEREFVDNEEVEKIVEKEISYNQGLVHIFYEVLGNAQDNYFRSIKTNTPLNKIEVDINKETGEISVWNDGCWIPTVIHKWDKDEEVIDNNPHYETEIIFGHLNSSSNYDDEKTARLGGGLHGVGVKLTNIFSKEFIVETFDPNTGLLYTQKWEDNMSIVNKPKIKKLSAKKGYTKVIYKADFERFGVKGYNNNVLDVIKKMCIDCGMATGQKVYFNSELIKVKDMLSYTKYYTDKNKIEFKSNNSIVILCEKDINDIGFSQVSFVNGINTNKGGVHVEEWKKGIFRSLLEKIKIKFAPKGKNATPLKLTAKNIENYFMIFVNCNLENPEFEGQTKGILSSPAPMVNVPVSKIMSIMKWDFLVDIQQTLEIQGMKELMKTDGKKDTNVSISKADDANKAGTLNSLDCTLFITEGDSAKAFAVKGISSIEEGTDWYGVLPVRGKVLNVRGASSNQINDNKEITNLKKMLGLQHGLDYNNEKNMKTLRYGKVCILTDADPDGDHIKGLIINFFHFFFPSLISKNFIMSLRTPIVKATIGTRTINFYYLKNFKEWVEKQTTRYTVKYYKGLGTSKDEEILEIFENPRYVQYIDDKTSSDTIDKIFDKKRSDDRKEWLEKYEEKEFVYETKNGSETVPISSFFNNEMIGFSIYDNKRSIPNVIDGLKPSQRKALWVGLKVLNTTKDYKVAQFAAEVAKEAEYHHGETSMEQAIIGMAQTFLGSNNIALFQESGQFGTRISGGKDSAASRYIFTKLAIITRYILRKEDDPILKYQEDEGKHIEPYYFVPIIPMLLVNGCSGIGTGYSSDIPAYNPLDLVDWIKVWLKDGKEESSDYPKLEPWYMNFKGKIEKDGDNKRYKVYGNYEKKGTNYYEIIELPIGVWTDDYKEILNLLKKGVVNNSTKVVKKGYEINTISQLKEELTNRGLTITGSKKVLIDKLKQNDKDMGVSAVKNTQNTNQYISKWEWHGDAYNVKFKVWTKPNVEVDFDNSKFKLVNTIGTTNMTAFNNKGGMKKYDNVEHIMNDFCEVRLHYYLKRKKYLLKILKEELYELEAKAKFITIILNDFTLLKQTEEQLFNYLEKEKFWKKKDSYSYLTDMAVRSFNKDKYDRLLKEIDDKNKDINYISKTSPKQMWSNELNDFVKQYHKWMKEINESHSKLSKQKIKRRK